MTITTILTHFSQIFFMYDHSQRSTVFFFFFNDTATTEIYTLSLHDALPISCGRVCVSGAEARGRAGWRGRACGPARRQDRSEEHTSELQSQSNLVCRLLLEKKKTYKPNVVSYWCTQDGVSARYVRSRSTVHP